MNGKKGSREQGGFMLYGGKIRNKRILGRIENEERKITFMRRYRRNGMGSTDGCSKDIVQRASGGGCDLV